MFKRTLFLLCLLAGGLLSLAAGKRAERPIMPAVLTDLVMEYAPDIQPISPEGRVVRVSSYLEIQVNTELAPGDQIRLATQLVSPDGDASTEVSGIWTMVNAACRIEGSDVVCVAGSPIRGTIYPVIAVGYTVTTSACTADGWLAQSASYTIGDGMGDLLDTWSGGYRLPCFTKKR